jgi:hypothetical protein
MVKVVFTHSFDFAEQTYTGQAGLSPLAGAEAGSATRRTVV